MEFRRRESRKGRELGSDDVGSFVSLDHGVQIGKMLVFVMEALVGVHAGRSLTCYFLDMLLRSGFIDHVWLFTRSPMLHIYIQFSTPTRTFTLNDSI